MKKLFEYAKRVSVGTWVRGVLSLVSIVNMALAAFGKTPLNIEYGELYTAISLIFAAAVGFASYWKNNSFTSAAIEADTPLISSSNACLFASSVSEVVVTPDAALPWPWSPAAGPSAA